MGRARGSSALMAGAFETTYGTPPVAGFIGLPFVSSNLGEERGLISSDLLGLGREPQDPTYDVANNDGDVTVPVDVRALGYWLKLLFGAPSSVASGTASGALSFTAQPAVNSTVTVNGTAFTFVASGAAGNQVNIGASLAATIASLATALNASAVAGVALATYAGAASTLTVTYKTAGGPGNAFTLAASTAPASNATAPATLSGGTMAHAFTSGALVLPSMSVEIGNPDVPSFTTNYGIRGNQLKIALQRSGLLNAVVSCIAQGETVPTPTSNAGTVAAVPITRFAQATGTIKRNGAVLGSVVGADFTYSNALDKVETIRPDGRIEDADPGMVAFSGSLTTRFRDNVLLTDATGQTPVDLSYGWTLGAFSLIIDAPRVYLPQVKRPVSGPNGIQAQANWQASGGAGHSCTITLINDVASYA